MAASGMLLLLAGWGSAGVRLAPAAPAERPTAAQAAYEQQVRPALRRYCGGCHGLGGPEGPPQAGVNLAAYPDVTSLQRDQETWRRVLAQLRDGAMPPDGLPQPEAREREELAAWLAATLDDFDEALLPADPGRVVLHRLNRTEYNNTVRDLFGVPSRPADRFPADGAGGAGFDNNAETLFIPPLLMERYLEAAGQVAAEVKPERLLIVRPSAALLPREAARRILAHFALRAYRRPVEAAEVEGLLKLYDLAARHGDPFEKAVRYALKAVLVSPNFLFRSEQEQLTAAAYPITDYELASRLSYFLWASLPDEELFRLAGQAKLREPAVLAGQVRRMLRDPKSRGLAESFAGQWLRVRDLTTTAKPDPRSYPHFTPSLRDAMVEEAVETVHAVLREDASLLLLIDADQAYLNEELARHYGIEGVTGPELRRVRLTRPEGTRHRGGILTLGSVLTVTSYPQRTSPVLRGKWVLEEVLGVSVPPPPPNAGTLPPDERPKDGLTLRQRLEQHRAKPQCASCHERIDPVGFALENYDATGRWRTEVGGQPVDASGVLTTGETVNGPMELKRQVLARKEQFVRNLAEKLLAYALGRGLEWYDVPAVRKICAALEKNGYHGETLVQEIVRSYPFQYRKNDRENG